MKSFFGTTKDNKEVFCYTLYDNDNYMNILNYGATIQSLVIKNNRDELVDVVLGFDNIEQYEEKENRTYMGAVCGRYANRIANGRFYINGDEYNLTKNNNGNCLHSGYSGFDTAIFEVEDFKEDSVTLSLLSPDSEGGFPGDFSLKVKYTFKNNSLLVEYFATTTKDCPTNLTNHSYFNLLGKGTILSHKLKIDSDYYMNVDDNGLANGNISNSNNSPFDFTNFKEVQIGVKYAKKIQPSVAGIDHHFYVNITPDDYKYFATLCAPDDSLHMDVYTNQCGGQIYSGNYIPDLQAKNGIITKHSGLCIETQSVPNAMSFSYLPSPILKSEQDYYHKTGFIFY
ncbi:aldose epimerase family protein [Romboutsia sp.]|uniref:aldose epimerase family protein n=1 Tax=Romboutsia sp. TaxID=1965302 RepID=UPI003F3B1549